MNPTNNKQILMYRTKNQSTNYTDERSHQFHHFTFTDFVNVPIASDADVLRVSAHFFLTKEGGKEHVYATKPLKFLRERLLCLRSSLNVAFHMSQI